MCRSAACPTGNPTKHTAWLLLGEAVREVDETGLELLCCGDVGEAGAENAA